MYILTIIISILTISTLAPIIGRWLDGLMDYGKILGFVRYRLALNATKNKAWFKEETAKANKGDFSQRLTDMDGLYWKVAKDDFWLTGWLCINCMVGRIALIISLFTFGLGSCFCDGLTYFLPTLLSVPIADHVLNKMN